MFSSDHIVSFTLSALLHALGLLAVGYQVLHRPAAELAAVPGAGHLFRGALPD